MKVKRIVKWFLIVLLAYAVIGGVYYLTGVLQQLILGEQIVFSPLVGLPLTIIGWPQMVCADLVHYPSLGLRLPAVMALVSLAILVSLLIINRIKTRCLRKKIVAGNHAQCKLVTRYSLGDASQDLGCGISAWISSPPSALFWIRKRPPNNLTRSSMPTRP